MERQITSLVHPHELNNSSTNANRQLHNESPRTIFIDNIDGVFKKKRDDFDLEKENMSKILSLKKSISVDCLCVNGVDMPYNNSRFSQVPSSECLFPKGIEKKISCRRSIILGPLKSLHNIWKVSERNQLVSRNLSLLRQAQIDLEMSRLPESRESRIENLKNLGDMGVALFSPLDAAFGYDDLEERNAETLKDKSEVEKELIENDTDSATLSSEFDDDIVDIDPIVIVKECPDVLLESPYILSRSLMQQIADRALPNVLQGLAWKRLYSLNRDGDSFQTFLRNVKYHSNTLIIVRTTKDSIFGGLAGSAWEERKNTSQKKYFGTGRSFLFSVNKDLSSSYNLNIYRWTGDNNYNQICDASEERIAMGGGGLGFGLCLQENFARGSTDYCATFHNDPLVPDGYFDVLELEVYGFIYPW